MVNDICCRRGSSARVALINFILLCACALLSSCSLSHPRLPPLSASARLDEAATVATLARIETFEQASGLLMIDGSELQDRLRVGFFVNRDGTLRADVYPNQGFIALGSAVISPNRVTALDRVKRVGVDSEQVTTTLEQVTGLAIDADAVVMALTGRLPAGRMLNFVEAVALDSGGVLLRSANQRSEIEVYNGKIQRVTVLMRDGRRIEAGRNYFSVTSSDGREISTFSYSTSNLSYSRAVAPRMFELDTAGYRIRTRLQ